MRRGTMFCNRRWSWFSVSLIVCLVFFVDPGRGRELSQRELSQFENLENKFNENEDLADDVWKSFLLFFKNWKTVYWERSNDPRLLHVEEIIEKVKEFEIGIINKKDLKLAVENFLLTHRNRENKRFRDLLTSVNFIHDNGGIPQLNFIRWVQAEERSARVYDFANLMIDFWQEVITKDMFTNTIQSPQFLNDTNFVIFPPGQGENNQRKSNSKSLTEYEILEIHINDWFFYLFFRDEKLWLRHGSEYKIFFMNMHIQRSKKLKNKEIITLLEHLNLFLSPQNFSAALVEKKTDSISSAIKLLVEDIKVSVIKWGVLYISYEEKFEKFVSFYQGVSEDQCIRNFDALFEELYGIIDAITKKIEQDPNYSYSKIFDDINNGLKVSINYTNVKNSQNECKLCLWAKGIDIEHILDKLPRLHFQQINLALPRENNINLDQTLFSKKTATLRKTIEILSWIDFMDGLLTTEGNEWKILKFESNLIYDLERLYSTNEREWTDTIKLVEKIYITFAKANYSSNPETEKELQKYKDSLKYYEDVKLNQEVDNFIKKLRLIK